MEKKPLSHILAGVIIAAVVIIYSMGLQLMDMGSNKALAWLSYLIIIALLVYFIVQYGKAHDDNKSFSELFTYGFKAAAVSTIISLAFMAIFFVVFPEYLDKMMETGRAEALKQPGVTEEQIDKGMEFAKKFFWVIFILGGIFMNMFLGAAGSLLGAAIAKKNPQTPFQQS